jgi:hypothetical protein
MLFPQRGWFDLSIFKYDYFWKVYTKLTY